MVCSDPERSSAGHGGYTGDEQMTQNGPTTMESTDGGTASAGGEYVVCRMCTKRFKLAVVGGDVLSLDELRCECGARLHAYDVPAELSAPARGVLPRLTRFWVAGREDGYWEERRYFRRAAAERVGASPRQVRFAYEAGRRMGARLRSGAHLHALRVMRMKGTPAASGGMKQHAAA